MRNKKRIILTLSLSMLFALSLTSCKTKNDNTNQQTQIIEEKYTITYHLNGGLNNIENPLEYKKGDEINLKPAQFDKLEFEGWYLDPEFNNKIEKISPNMSSDIDLYAKYIGPRIYYYTNQLNPVTVYGKDIELTYTEIKGEEIFGLGDTILSEIEKEEIEFDILNELYETFDSEYDYLFEQYVISSIISATTDEDEDYAKKFVLDEALDRWDEYNTNIEIAIASSKYRNLFFKDKSNIEIDEYISSLSPDSSGELAELNAQANNLKQEYYSESRDTFEILVDLVNVFNQIGTLKGYDNYLDYRYEYSYCRDYKVEDTSGLETYFKNVIRPIKEINKIKLDEFVRKSDLEDVKNYYDLDKGFFGHYLDYFDDYAKVIGGGYLDTYNAFFETGNYFLSSKPNYTTTAYAWHFNDEEGLLFFGGKYQNSETFIHEFGHYNAFMNGGDDDYTSYDISELQSQGNELLFYKYLLSTDLYNEEVREAYLDYHIYYMAKTVIIAYIMNEMEKYIYLNDINDITEEELINKYQTLCEECGGPEYKNRIDDYLYLVLMNYHGYYISYATSALAALELYAKSLEDYDEAIEMYRNIYKKQERTLEFGELLESVGLYDVFDEQCYDLLSTLLN